MKKLFVALLFILFAIWVGFLIHKDAGYVMISYNGYTIESSLWVMAACLIILFYFVYFITRFIKNALNIGGKYHRWDSKRKSEKARNLTNQGLCELAEGNWKDAQTKLAKAAKHHPNPLINYLACARAAQAAHNYNSRDAYLRRAHASTQGSEVAVGLTQATLQIDSKQWEQALATLNHLNQIAPNHRYILKLLSDAYLELKDWPQLQRLLPRLKRTSILNDLAIETLDKQVHLGLLCDAAKTHHIETLHDAWNNTPKKWHADPQALKLYTDFLIDAKDFGLAAELIAKFLKKNWNAELVTNYGLAPTNDINRQIAIAEGWLEKHPGEPELLLCSGRLCFKGGFLGKAEHLLKACVSASPLPQAYMTLGQVLEALGKREEALEAYKQGISG